MNYAPIIIPVERSETFEERLEKAALKYSTREELREAFRDGARWEHGTGEFSWQVAFGILLFIWIAVQLVAGFFGTLEGASTPDRALKMPGKTIYIFPGFAVGYEVARWMVK